MLFSKSKGVEIKTRRKPKRAPMAAHAMFVPSLTLWGAAVAGLAVYVLPMTTVARFVPGQLISALGDNSAVVVAAIAAAFGAALMYVVASAMRRSAIGPAESPQTIVPVEELGSESLDTPVDEGEFVFEEYEDEPVDDGYQRPDTSWLDALDEPAEEKVELAANRPIEEDPPEPEPEVVRRKTARPVPKSAIEKLRGVPPQELSLVEMVERLALALQDNRASSQAKAEAGSSAALADALKTLSRFTEAGFSDENTIPSEPVAQTRGDVTEREMREALAKLQGLRGAA